MTADLREVIQQSYDIEPDRKYTPAEVKVMLNKDIRSIWRLIKHHKLKATKIGRDYSILGVWIVDYLVKATNVRY